MSHLTVDIHYYDSAFVESQHPRERQGRFSRSSAGPTPTQHVVRSVKQVSKHTAKTVRGFGSEEHHVLKQNLARAKPEHRARLTHAVMSIGRSIPQLLITKWHGEKHHAMSAAAGLNMLRKGQRPTPEQMQGIRSIGTRVLMTAGSVAFGDPSGSLAHLAVAFGEEAVQHVIIEHALKSMTGVGRLLMKKKPTHDAAQDEELLQAFIEAIAKAIQDLDSDEIMRRIEAKRAAPKPSR